MVRRLTVEHYERTGKMGVDSLREGYTKREYFTNQTECCGFDETISDNLGALGKVVFGIVDFE